MLCSDIQGAGSLCAWPQQQALHRGTRTGAACRAARSESAGRCRRWSVRRRHVRRWSLGLHWSSCRSAKAYKPTSSAARGQWTAALWRLGTGCLSTGARAGWQLVPSSWHRAGGGRGKRMEEQYTVATGETAAAGNGSSAPARAPCQPGLLASRPAIVPAAASACREAAAGSPAGRRLCSCSSQQLAPLQRRGAAQLPGVQHPTCQSAARPGAPPLAFRHVRRARPARRRSQGPQPDPVAHRARHDPAQDPPRRRRPGAPQGL